MKKMIDRKQVVKINGIYTSMLFRDWHAVEYIVCVNGTQYFVRSPYKSLEKAELMRNYLRGNINVYPLPEYMPIVEKMHNGIVR